MADSLLKVTCGRSRIASVATRLSRFFFSSDSFLTSDDMLCCMLRGVRYVSIFFCCDVGVVDFFSMLVGVVAEVVFLGGDNV